MKPKLTMPQLTKEAIEMNTPSAKDEPLSKEAQEFADKIFPCNEPCDSYGICHECCERNAFVSGYNFGYRALKSQLATSQARCGKLEDGLSWSLDIVDMYDERLKQLGDNKSLVDSAVHLAAKKKAREALAADKDKGA